MLFRPNHQNKGVGTVTAREMEGIARMSAIEKTNQPIIGQIGKNGKHVVSMLPETQVNRHALVFGASHSGKTNCFTIPNMLQAARRGESLVVTDMSGGLYEQTAQYFKNQGYTVRYLNLKDLNNSDGWDCLKEITNNETKAEDRATVFADIVIRCSNPSDKLDCDAEDEGQKALLKALLLRAALDPKLVERGKTSATEGNHIGQCIEYLKDPRGAMYIDEEVFNEQVVPLEARSCLSVYNSVKQAFPRTGDKCVSDLTVRLDLSHRIQTLMGTDEIDLTLPGKEKCVYYVVLDDIYPTNNWIATLFLSFLVLDLAEYADSKTDRRCEVPVNFILNEFGFLPAIPNFDRMIATVRSRGLAFSLLVQDVCQLENRYPRIYKAIIGNCATMICMDMNDMTTREYFVDKTDVDSRIGFDEEFLRLQGKKTCRLFKFRVDQHPDYKKMLDAAEHPTAKETKS